MQPVKIRIFLSEADFTLQQTYVSGGQVSTGQKFPVVHPDTFLKNINFKHSMPKYGIGVGFVVVFFFFSAGTWLSAK